MSLTAWQRRGGREEEERVTSVCEVAFIFSISFLSRLGAPVRIPDINSRTYLSSFYRKENL
jgi:hypothetical protein